MAYERVPWKALYKDIFLVEKYNFLSNLYGLTSCGFSGRTSAVYTNSNVQRHHYGMEFIGIDFQLSVNLSMFTLDSKELIEFRFDKRRSLFIIRMRMLMK